MRTSSVLALGWSSFFSSITSTHALHSSQRRDASAPKVVHHEFHRRHIANPIEHDRKRMQRRSGTVNADLTNEETLYYMIVNVGTPPQSLELHLDTGSSDLWVNVPNSSLCASDGDPCQGSGVYNSKDSSTYKYINDDFNITYADGTGAVGDYISDVVQFASVTLQGQQLGVGLSSTSKQGILGIGYINNEASVGTEGDTTYSNVPQSLVNDGYIESNAYSLWLNDLDASTGSILFGGVDSAKFTGTLETLPILPFEGSDYSEFIIALTDIGSNGNSTSIASNIALPALFDSGTSLLYLPNLVTQDIYTALNAQYDPSQGTAVVDCSFTSSDQTIDFTFSSPTIRVPLNELILVSGSANGEEICILGIGPSGDDQTTVLGDTFLRSAYVVYDLDGNTLSLAQTDFNSTTNNVQQISKDSGVPFASVVSNPVTSVGPLNGVLNNPKLTHKGAAAGIPAPSSFLAAIVGVAALLIL